MPAGGGHQRRGAEKRDAIIAFVGRFVAEHGYSPSVREIAAACGVKSPSVAEFHVERLARDGRISRRPGIARSIRLTSEAD